MGEVFHPRPVLLIAAAFSRHDDALVWARDTLAEQWGRAVLESTPFAHAQTDYYDVEMGTGLRKQFFAFEDLIDPATLPEKKHQSNRWESEYQQRADHSEKRPLNIDPGYITQSKLVLATTKNHSHRIYLQDGIYAEITLRYHKKQWCEHPWTYPDYRQPAYHAFFTQCRDYLRSCGREL